MIIVNSRGRQLLYFATASTSSSTSTSTYIYIPYAWNMKFYSTSKSKQTKAFIRLDRDSR